MNDSTGNIYFSSGSSRISYSRQRADSDDHSILPHFLTPLPYESQFHTCLGPRENPQNIGVQFMRSCPNQDSTQLDSDILQRRFKFEEDSSPTTIAYPESSQRTTSHVLSPYVADTSDFSNHSCDLSTLHAGQMFRRGSWPTHSQVGYSPWIPSPPRVPRSPVSEPPESTSDESYQDSDVEEVTQMSPMMNQFQIQSSRNIELPPQRTYHAQALQPSIMTFQLSESMLQRVDALENGKMLRSTDDESEITNASPSSTFSASFSIPSRLQGPSTRLQHEGENAIQTSQFRVPTPSSIVIPFPSHHSPTNTRAGDQKPSGSKPQKRSKMHPCSLCPKSFPRPSGLKTHMNTHSGAKPYKCTVPSCEKTFAVRSNAKRHLRTHGINPSALVASRPGFTIGFEEPVVTQVHNVGRQPSRYRWISHNAPSRECEWPHQASSSSAIESVSQNAITFQTSMSSMTSSSLSTGSDDGYDEFASSCVLDVYQSRGDYRHGETDEFSGTYPDYRQHSQRG